MRSGEIDQLLWGREIDNTTGGATRAADVISKPCSWFVASGVLDGLLLRSFFSPFIASSFSSLLGDLGRLSVCEGVLLQRRECHVSLRDIEALCGLFCTGDRWCRVCSGACALKVAGGHGHTTPETVVSGMSGRRTGSVYARDRCDREE